MADTPSQDPSWEQLSPADELRLTMQKVVDNVLEFEDNRSFALKFRITMPAHELGSGKAIRRLQPIMGLTKAELEAVPNRMKAEVLLARRIKEGESPDIMVALGNVTLGGEAKPFAVPMVERNDYFPIGFQALGPYDALAITGVGDDLLLQAKVPNGPWRLLSTDPHESGIDVLKPGLFLGSRLTSLLTNRDPSTFQQAATPAELSAQLLLPPEV